MNENDRRILAKACGLCWHEIVYDSDDGHYFCQLCGDIPEWPHNCHPTFATADDWELVRQLVVVPNQEAFVVFLWSEETWPLNKWIALSCERKCQYAADFIKTSPDLFP